ncbi:hypothetical protein [Coraliomargarita sinensis]|uniref:hypothetical protein n=1 Tax=Coraliomargarita sinensis TaxID=2174842 RepID=UPI001E2FFB3D|nr:hypothetical protein [Coraliomargarita sinensis]
MKKITCIPEDKHSTMGRRTTGLLYIQSKLDKPIYAAANPRIISNLKSTSWGISSMLAVP